MNMFTNISIIGAVFLAYSFLFLNLFAFPFLYICTFLALASARGGNVDSCTSLYLLAFILLVGILLRMIFFTRDELVLNFQIRFYYANFQAYQS